MGTLQSVVMHEVFYKLIYVQHDKRKIARANSVPQLNAFEADLKEEV